MYANLDGFIFTSLYYIFVSAADITTMWECLVSQYRVEKDKNGGTSWEFFSQLDFLVKWETIVYVLFLSLIHEFV